MPLTIGGPQQRRLLALLLSRPGQRVGTDRLVECMWPDGLAPSGAQRSVMTYVSRLRAALGEDVITTVSEGYLLELDGSTLDRIQFEALITEAGTAEPGRAVDLYDRALELWRGAAYGELGSEWWLLAEAERLNELRIVAMEERSEALLALGHHHRAAAELERLVAQHPLRERPVALLMRALVASGRHVDALRDFHAFRTRLGEETGLEPSAELVQLERSIASGQPVAHVSYRARLLRGYVLHDVLGEGAFGRVFAATQPGTNRQVAIKAIRPALADSPEFVHRFEAEAQLVAKLEHPHIVPLYDYWREPGAAYLVFRLLTGGTAHGALIAGGQFDVARTSRLVEEVGSALMAAHAAGVVHCDIKPSNVLLDESGNSYLSDFGISVVSSVELLGDRTRAYAAPELADRSGDTFQSDIFSFGCMLWELLAGGSPLAAMSGSRPQLPSLVGRINEPCEGIDAVLAKATSADPSARFESMAELIIAWRDAVGRPSGVLTPMPGSTSSTSSARRRAAQLLTTNVSASVNPYKGLRAFTEADASDFFGRADISASLHNALVAHGFVAVVGPSGSGKSSLVHAGLAPLVRRDGARLVTMVPGDRPTAALRQALSHVATTDVRDVTEIELIEALVRGTGSLVLIVDQFEECWTLAEREDRERFLSALAVARQHGVGCVVTVRADLYDRPLQLSLIGEMVSRGTFPVPPLTPLALEEAVVAPAARNGVEFEDGVATAIVAEANEQPGGLPMLQFALAELYERRQDGRITAQSLQELGGIGGAVGRRAEATYDAMSDTMRQSARELFGRLVVPGEGAPDTRRRVRLSELSEPVREVADRFVAARLLVADHDLATREPVFEVAHEALLVNWQRLRGWLEADRRWLGQLHHLAAATRAWNESGRADSELYRGSRLESVLEALPEKDHELSGDEHDFVEASRRARDAVRERELRENRRLRTLLAAVAIVLALAVVAGVLAFAQRRSADRSRRDAEITTLASQSGALRSSQRDVAALLAVEAVRLRPDSQSLSALFGSFSADPSFMGYYKYDGITVFGAVVPGSNSALIIPEADRLGADNPPMRRVDLATGELGPLFQPVGPHDHGNPLVAVSGNGAIAAEYTQQFVDGTYQPNEVAVFEIATGRMIGRPIEHVNDEPFNGPGVVTLAVNHDGSQVVVAGGTDGTARVFRTADGRLLTTIPPAPDATEIVPGHTSAASWGPDGSLYVGSWGTHLRVFDPATFALQRDITVPRYATGGQLEFSSDGGFLIARGDVGLSDGSRAGTAARIDLADGSVVWSMRPEEDEPSTCSNLAFSEPEDRVWCADYFGVIRGRSLTTGELDGTTIEHQRGYLQRLELLDTTDGRYLVTMGGNSATIGRWRVDGSGPISHKIAPGRDVGGYSPDGRWLLLESAASDGTDRFVVSLWDVASQQEVQRLPSTPMLEAVWLGDGRLATMTDPGQLHLFDPSTGATSNVVIPLEADYRTLAPIAASRLAFGYSDGHVDVFDTTTGARVVRLQVVNPFKTFVPAVDQIAASDDGSRIYVTAQGLYEFDGKDGHQLAHAEGTQQTTVAVRGGSPLAVGYIDGRIGLLDPVDLSLRRTLPGGRGLAGTLRFTADGRLLLAQSYDQRMSMYDVTTGQRFGDPVVIGYAGADLRSDGREIAVGTEDGSGISVWSLDPDTMSKAACQIAGRNLTQAEWTTYVGDLGTYRKTCPEFATG